jgi:glycosyltransferase EpsD
LNVKLAIVGDGPEMKELKKLTHILNLNEDVTFTGFVKDPASWFNKAKIFLLCSESEALPTALMQAMSCKLIVIAPNIGNISCLVENNHNGYLFDVDDISSFYELMKEVYINYYSLIHITENARKKILLEYTHENATIIWNEIIKSKFIIT